MSESNKPLDSGAWYWKAFLFCAVVVVIVFAVSDAVGRLAGF